jgi:mono/diheme cytochrome c family protein
MKTSLTGLVALMAVSLVAGGSRTANATVDMQKKAKAAGVEAPNCLTCHGEKLPKKGASTMNDKGKWLLAEKEKRKAKEADGAWLKEYVEPKK